MIGINLEVINSLLLLKRVKQYSSDYLVLFKLLLIMHECRIYFNILLKCS